VRPAVHIAPIERLRRPRSSDDPRAAAAVTGWGDLTALAVSLGLPAAGPLRMPSIKLS
jgi:protease IV